MVRPLLTSASVATHPQARSRSLSAGAGSEPEEALFGEGPGGVVVAGPADVVAGLPGAIPLGTVGGDRLVVTGLIDAEVAALRERYEGAIPAAYA